MTKRYGFEPQGPILVEIFPKHDDFAVRTLGLPGLLGALGACFGRVVTLDSPRARPPGDFNWQATLWHEMAHVFTMQLSNYRVPRWLTEGISVYEEGLRRPEWARDSELAFARAWADKKILPLSDLNSGFTRPDTIELAYFQASLVVVPHREAAWARGAQHDAAGVRRRRRHGRRAPQGHRQGDGRSPARLRRDADGAVRSARQGASGARRLRPPARRGRGGTQGRRREVPGQLSRPDGRRPGARVGRRPRGCHGGIRARGPAGAGGGRAFQPACADRGPRRAGRRLPARAARVEGAARRRPHQHRGRAPARAPRQAPGRSGRPSRSPTTASSRSTRSTRPRTRPTAGWRWSGAIWGSPHGSSGPPSTPARSIRSRPSATSRRCCSPRATPPRRSGPCWPPSRRPRRTSAPSSSCCASSSASSAAPVRARHAPARTRTNALAGMTARDDNSRKSGASVI